jgi:bla regulator protein blaR1
MADIFNHLWQSTMFGAVVAVLCFACRRNRARLRYGLWFVASAKFLVPFAALAAVGGFVQWQQAPAPIRSVVASPAVRDFNAPFAAMWLDPTTMVTSAAQPQLITLLLFGVWLCGFAAITLRRLKQWREIRGAVRASTPWETALPRLRQGYGGQAVPAGIEIRVAPTVLEPGVVGLRRPVILLPAGIDSYLTANQFAAVVAHEVCHVRRRDSLTAAIHMAVEALFWFHPMVWWIGARLMATREQACDEHVVAETAEPVAYAEGIVTICRRYVEAPLMTVAGVGGADVKARIEAILSNRIGLRLTRWKRLALATAAVTAFVGPLAAGTINRATLSAEQSQGVTPGQPFVDPEARFEVVSIKRFDTSSGTPRASMTPGRFDIAGASLSLLVGQALVTPVDRIFGLPDWANTELYTVTAKAPDDPPPAALALNVMLANLLKDRANLATHRETRQLPVYDLVFARTDKRLGPGLKPASPECQAALTARLEAVQRGGPVPPPLVGVNDACNSMRINPGGMVGFNGVPMSRIAQLLTRSVGRPVIDKTGLTGYFDFTLQWTPQPGSEMPIRPAGEPPAPPPPAADPDGPNLFTAVQEQLGLKLESTRGPVEVIVIDRLEKPRLD